ncbi:lipid A deacylase LpxR family protein [Phaeocystidibacter luteus]|uniref:Lipid A deacylase LpxR family protein n=1 Tax=Phaeocystidibacter luteus TaxID=911197 RepID=A0A6N6RJ08_9FLAO|nr:lipid A deacylase LpxR family protein [Phaeocystidibacter luteus]KAB2810394.1 lipid A deacylase LpxR family protein [Phaeocystidibacter luteus]
MIRFCKILAVLLLLPLFGSGQMVDTSFRQASFVEFSSENDLYQIALKADKEFTNGLSLRVGDQAFRNLGTRWLAIPMKSGVREYAWSISQDMYTPEDIRNTEVDTTDRPYCGLLYLTFSAYSTDWNKGRRWTSELQVGIQGPAAGAKQTQNWLHSNTNNWIVEGWDNQIGNGLLLDYRISVQDIITKNISYLESSTFATLQVGTMRNFVAVGLQNKIGWFNSSYANFGGLQNRNQPRNQEVKASNGDRTVFLNRPWQAYLVADIGVSTIFYDGTTQGSLIPFEESVYTLDPAQITRFNAISRLGISLSYGRTQLSYLWVVTGYQVRYSNLIGWGEFRLSVSL